jgi:hypothetical protein
MRVVLDQTVSKLTTTLSANNVCVARTDREIICPVCAARFPWSEADASMDVPRLIQQRERGLASHADALIAEALRRTATSTNRRRTLDMESAYAQPEMCVVVSIRSGQKAVG